MDMKQGTDYRTPLHLQLFAGETQTTLLPGLTVEMKTFYEDTLIDVAEPKLVHDQFGETYNIPPNSGKVIEFRKFAKLPKALTPLTEGVTPDGNNINVTAITAEINQYGDYTRVSDILDMTAIDKVIVQVTKNHGGQAGRTLDTITREVLHGGTNVYFAPSIVGGVETPVLSRATLTANSLMTPDLCFRAQAELETMDADTIGGNYIGIIHPYVAYDLMRHPEWIATSQYAGSVQLFEGEIGMIANIRFIKTSEAKIWKDDTCPSDGAGGYSAVFGTLILGAGAYATTEVQGGGLEVIVKPRGAGEDALNQRSTVGWKATKTAARLVEENMIRIESLSAYSDKVAAAN